MELNEILKAKRLKMRLTQIEFAELLDMPIRTYQNIERGYNFPSYKNLMKITIILKGDNK